MLLWSFKDVTDNGFLIAEAEEKTEAQSRWEFSSEVQKTDIHRLRCRIYWSCREQIDREAEKNIEAQSRWQFPSENVEKKLQMANRGAKAIAHIHLGVL